MPDEFEAREVIVVDRKNGQSVFRRISEEKLKNWLEEHAISVKGDYNEFKQLAINLANVYAIYIRH